MKYLAILKDSLREAIDAKVFYVTVVLSILVSLLVLSVSYRAVPMEEMVAEYTRFITVLTEMRHQQVNKMGLDGVKRLDVADFKRLDKGEEPWSGDYHFILDLELWEGDKPPEPQPKAGVEVPADGPKVPVAKQPKITANSLHLPLLMTYQWFENFTIKSLPSQDPKHLRFDVTTKGIQHGFRSRPEWFHQPGLFFGLWQLPIRFFKLEQIVRFIGNDIIGKFGAAVTMLLSCIVTAFFLPNMMAKGTVDLLLVKPINRTVLFIYKFLGGLTFMLLNTTIIMVGVWIGLGLQSGYWINSFLLCIPVFTFQFMIFYAVSALAGVVTKSPIVSILAVIFLWGLLSVAGWAYWLGVEQYKVQLRPTNRVDMEAQVIEEPPDHWAITAIDIIHAVLPRYKDLDWLTARAIKEELIRPADQTRPESAREIEFQTQILDHDYGKYRWLPSILVSAVFIVIFVGLAAWRFTARDY